MSVVVDPGYVMKTSFIGSAIYFVLYECYLYSYMYTTCMPRYPLKSEEVIRIPELEIWMVVSHWIKDIWSLCGHYNYTKCAMGLPDAKCEIHLGIHMRCPTPVCNPPWVKRL
ncbi:hypothetical protein STEG23_006694 [Scotinomys teguina]